MLRVSNACPVYPGVCDGAIHRGHEMHDVCFCDIGALPLLNLSKSFLQPHTLPSKSIIQLCERPPYDRGDNTVE